jgi:flavin-dependent dehydrogenase
LVVGADGTRSMVAQGAGLLHDDRRYMAVSQRAYVEGVAVHQGEAAFFFDGDLFPGYGWMFPMSGGRANIGVGILAETQTRYGISVPRLFQSFVEKLRVAHPGCARIRLAGKPLGGIVKTYGGSGPNHFDGGVLVGDAGCFVDPMTGEGITPAAESGLLASAVLAAAVERGRSDTAYLSRYEQDFRAYFDPAMRYLDLCATVMRNRFMSDFWLSTVARGCQIAAEDPDFARIAGAGFGGMDVRPLSILSHIWSKLVEDMGTAATGMLGAGGRVSLSDGFARSAHWFRALGSWSDGWWQSLLDDPLWHAAWATDAFQKWTQVVEALGEGADPRAEGPITPTA